MFAYISQCMSDLREGSCVVTVKDGSVARKTSSLRCGFFPIFESSGVEEKRVTMRRHPISSGELGISLNGVIEKAKGCIIAAIGILGKTSQPSKIAIISVESCDRLAPGPLNLCLVYSRSYRGDNAKRYSILQVKDLFKCTVEPISPKMRSCLTLNELASDANSIRGLTNTTFQDIPDT